MRLRPSIAAGLAASLAAACTVGPDYMRPSAPISTAFKEAAAPSPGDGWRPAQPADAIDRGAWWSIYADPVLDGLERRVVISNQNLAAAYAAYRQSTALVSESRAAFFPTLSTTASVQRSKSGSSRVVGGQIIGSGAGGTGAGAGGTGGAVAPSQPSTRTNDSLTVNGSWDIDVWGRVRRTVESQVATAQASAADLASARLSAQASLAADYFTLRGLDEQRRIFDETVAAYRRAETLTQNQYRAGVVARADVITAETQLQGAQASAVDLGVQRAQTEHAIALLVGVPPAALSIAEAPLARTVPEVPAGLPSALLERRPDIAAAERRVKAANALIGVNIAAYYPDIVLSGDGGYSTSSKLSQLFTQASSFWSLGLNATETLLDFGARRSRVRQSRFAYDQAVAVYRQTVLGGLQAVEDQLAALRVLDQEQAIRESDEVLARRAETITLNQYRSGIVNFTTVVQAQAIALTAEQANLSVRRARLAASVALIDNLGGGWTTADLPQHVGPVLLP